MNKFVMGVHFFTAKLQNKNKKKLHIDIFLFGKSNQHWVSKYDNTPVTVYKNTNELYINSVTAWHILQKTNSLNKSEFKSFGLL